MKKILIALFVLIVCEINAQTDSPLYIDSDQMKWVDTMYNSMTLDEKIGQLFMVAAYTNKGIEHEKEIKDLIQKENIGGLIFMQNDAIHQVELINEYQKLSKIPLLIGMDAEWDVSMRLDNTNRFPWAMTGGALENEGRLYEMGVQVAEHLKRGGAHFNFAPVVDVNVNPLNPIIGNRSYGSNPDNVAKKGMAYARGMQQNGILASAKHFPGHGDTDKDSHKTLPTISHDRARLDSIELKPFRDLIEEGVTGIMVAHLNVPALEPNEGVPASLSKKIVTDLLKNELGFKGIIITDALNMQGVTNNFPNGLTDYMAFEAGNDILLFSQAISVGKEKIKTALENGEIPMSRLEESVKKILMAKYYVGLDNVEEISTNDLMSDLNNQESKDLTKKIFEEAATLIKNEDNLLPINRSKEGKFAWVGLEEGEKETFYNSLNNYADVQKINIYENPNLDGIENYNCVFISVHKDNSTPYKSYRISQKSIDIINKIGEKTNVILVVFGSPYAIKDFDDKNVKSIVIAYQNHDSAMEPLPKLIFGELPFKGKLPVTLNQKYQYGTKDQIINGISIE